MRCLPAFAVVFVSSVALGSPQTVWQIGTPDHSYAEFAFAGDYPAYAKHFGTRPVVYEVGRSTPAKDWPFIQPGPADSWSAARAKPWTIHFNLPEQPRGMFTLRIELADVQAMIPPRYSVSIGSQSGTYDLSPGIGDQSLTNPKLGKPQKLEIVLPAAFFQKGKNEIRLACVEGSWVQYDAVTLVHDPEGTPPPAEIRTVAVRPTSYFIRRDGQLRRAVEVDVTTAGAAAELSLHVDAAGQSFDVPVKQLSLLGTMKQEIGVPDSAEPIDVKVTARLGSQSKSATASVPPARKWRVYVAASAHTDVGYTDIQPKCAERHCQNIEHAIDLLKKYPDFRWNLEVAWQAENFVNTRTGERLADFYRLAKEGKIGIQALYCNVLTGLCSTEEACRLTWYAHKLCREHGLPFKSAMISDVPTQEATLPMFLAGAGIRYFSSGINNDRAYNFTEMQKRCPCWWEAPDGSRVLMMYTYQYAQANQWALDQSLERAQATVRARLAEYEARQYPYDAVFLHGAVSDNCPLDARLAEVCQQWNERYEYPKLILSHNAEFFEYIEKKYGDKLPVFRGSAGTYWEDGAASSAKETKVNRNAHARLEDGQQWLALRERIASVSPLPSSRLRDMGEGQGVRASGPAERPVSPAGSYPFSAINEAWRNAILYDEHTWGAHCSISQPESEFTRAQWKIKAQFATDAGKQSKITLDQSVASLASLVHSDGPALVVFNQTGWPRTDLLQVKFPPGLGPADAAVPIHWNAEGDALMLAKDVPAGGYRVIKLGNTQSKPRSERPVKNNVIESRFYRVEFDASREIVSILDKETGKELVDRRAKFRPNQYMYVAGGSNATRIVMNPAAPAPELTVSVPEPRTLDWVNSPGLGQLMTVSASASMTPKCFRAVLVWDNIKRIDFWNSISKTQTYNKEAVYFAFPFAAKNPTIRYEVPGGIVNANKDMLPGACLDWFTMQNFVEIESPDCTITWASPDAPLFCIGDINRGKWLKELPITNGHIYSYVMNNYWHTNYLAGQGGNFSFRYSITSQAKANRVASARFGYEAAHPLVGVVVKGNPNGMLPAEPTSLIAVDEPNVMVVGTKLADEGQGLVVRLWEITGKATTAHLRLNRHIPAAKAQACNLVEEPQGPLDVHDGAVAVPIRGAGLATVKIE